MKKIEFTEEELKNLVNILDDYVDFICDGLEFLRNSNVKENIIKEREELLDFNTNFIYKIKQKILY